MPHDEMMTSHGKKRIVNRRVSQSMMSILANVGVGADALPAETVMGTMHFKGEKRRSRGRVVRPARKPRII